MFNDLLRTMDGKIRLVIITIISTSGVSPAVIIDGTCPEITPIKNLNMAAYCEGVWYQIARYANDFEKEGDCIHSDRRYENGKCGINITEVIDEKYIHIDGYLLTEPGSENMGVVRFQSQNIKETEGVDALPIYILDIDYDKYALLYDCRYNEKTNKRQDYAWILSRSKKLEGPAQEIVNDFINSSPLIDDNKLMWEHFDDKSCRVKS